MPKIILTYAQLPSGFAKTPHLLRIKLTNLSTCPDWAGKMVSDICEDLGCLLNLLRVLRHRFSYFFPPAFWNTPAQEVFRNLSKKYGNLFSVKIGKWWVVVLNDVELVRDALHKKPIDFADRPQMFSCKYIIIT